MKLLIILRGVPGCGKSTWAKNNFEGYIICPDDIRLMYCAPEMKVDGTFGISQKADKCVWEFVFKVLEQRMKLGCLTVIDATHTKESAINAYKKLCEKYNYTCYVKDFSEVPLETCKNRNKHRMGCFKFVPEEVIERMYENLTSSKIPSWCKSFKEIEDDVTLVSDMKQVKADNYDEVFFIGDIHGCYNPLEKFFKEHPFKETNLYVFVGDYIDRGTQNKEVLEFLIKHSYSHKNCIFLRGNHEKWLDLYSKGFIEEIKSKQFLDHTMKEIKDISKVAIKDFTDKLVDWTCIEFNHSYYYVTHGGIPEFHLYLSSKQVINGVGGYEESEKVDAHWSKGGMYSIHGHRNIYNVPVHNTEYTYNLCSDVEKGGYLRILGLSRYGIQTLIYKNDLPVLQNITDTLYESLKPSVSKPCDEYFSKLSKQEKE